MFHYTQPSIAYCVSISKLLALIGSLKSPTEIIQLSTRYPENNMLDLNSSYRQRVYKGFKVSNILLEIPYEPFTALFRIEKGLEQIIKSYKENTETITCKVGGHISTWEHNQKSDWVYYYAYWLRKGYDVQENYGTSFTVVEPFGKSYTLDSNKCSCDLGVLNKKCIHRYLIEWYRLSKQLNPINL